jgi:hypothetical protein
MLKLETVIHISSPIVVAANKRSACFTIVHTFLLSVTSVNQFTSVSIEQSKLGSNLHVLIPFQKTEEKLTATEDLNIFDKNYCKLLS